MFKHGFQVYTKKWRIYYKQKQPLKIGQTNFWTVNFLYHHHRDSNSRKLTGVDWKKTGDSPSKHDMHATQKSNRYFCKQQKTYVFHQLNVKSICANMAGVISNELRYVKGHQNLDTSLLKDRVYEYKSRNDNSQKNGPDVETFLEAIKCCRVKHVSVLQSTPEIIPDRRNWTHSVIDSSQALQVQVKNKQS